MSTELNFNKTNTGIKPKVVLTGRQHDEHARRYVWYPLSNLDFAGSQWMSPVWNPKIPKGRIVLIESFQYPTQVSNDGEEVATGSNGIVLGERTMGTDAQVRFLMGNAEGTGWMDKGMTNLDSMVDIDPATAMEVENMILPDGGVPETLIMFRDYLNSVVITDESPVGELAKKVLVEMKEGLRRSINWCQMETNKLEQELNDARQGGIGIKSLSETNKYYFLQIHRPLPEDKQGVNAGAELARALAPIVESIKGNTAPPPSTLQNDIEKEELQKKLEDALKTVAEQEAVIGELTEVKPDETGTTAATEQ